ncbi:MAG TPA: 30S ribosomal protein S20 [Thermoanaerobaculia bacterium]|jgi:small subunit ribosomal protein S20|nr:30S ribosomal protein S20 [Thermoanaerobaculia bacterium]
MANIKSAEKRIKQTARRQQRNRSVRSRLRGALKAFRSLEEKDRAQALPAAVSQIARARKKGVIHKKAAARYASRLAKRSAKKG